MKEVEAFENLPAPTSQNLGLHHLKAFQVSAGGIIQQGGKRLRWKETFPFSRLSGWVEDKSTCQDLSSPVADLIKGLTLNKVNMNPS